MAAFVLIHGAFMGGWVWQRMATTLGGLGHDCLRPTLTGCGERSHLLRPEISLAWHVEDVAQALFHEDLERVVLVGHGYGSMIAAAVAHRHSGKVAGVVHLDGVLPERGKSFAQLCGRAALRGGAVGPGRGDGGDWLIPPPTAESLGVSCRELGRWLSVRLQPFPRACLEDAYAYGDRDRQLPGVFLRTTAQDDRPAKSQAARAALSSMPVVELPLGPLPMITSPGRLAQALSSLAQEMGPSEPPAPRRLARPVRCKARGQGPEADSS